MTQARGFFERALALDPGNIEALVGTARVDVWTGACFMTDDRTANFTKAERTLTEVLSVAPQHAFAHAVLGLVRIVTNRAAQGIAHASGRWRWIGIWRTRTRLSVSAGTFWVVALKRKAMSMRRFASLLAIPWPTCR